MKFELSPYQQTLLEEIRVFPAVKINDNLFSVQVFCMPDMHTEYFKTLKQAEKFVDTFNKLEKPHIRRIK